MDNKLQKASIPRTDKNGMTEEQFLASYKPGDYELG